MQRDMIAWAPAFSFLFCKTCSHVNMNMSSIALSCFPHNPRMGLGNVLSSSNGHVRQYSDQNKVVIIKTLLNRVLDVWVVRFVVPFVC